MSYNDYNNGRLGVGGDRSSPDYQQGQAERERRQERDRQINTAAPSPPGPSGSSFQVQRESQLAGSPFVAPETMRTMAKSGASLFAVVCVVYLLFHGTWTWTSLAVYTAMSAVAGAAAGAAFYFALKLLAFLLKVAGVLLAIGVALHLFNIINLPTVLGRLSASLGL
jgi:hypothetical protein